MPITLAAAAKLCGVDKSTLRRAVRSGRISGVRDEFGVWQVEVCEVERCFTIAPSAPEQPQGAPAALPRDAVGNAVADALVALELPPGRDRRSAGPTATTGAPRRNNWP